MLSGVRFTGHVFSDLEAQEPILREIEGSFSMMTLHELEAGVKGKTWHLQKIRRP